MLTKDRTIEEHRKMWMWITRNIVKCMKEKVIEVPDIKHLYFDTIGMYIDLIADCFCCEYAYILKVRDEKVCEFCPLELKCCHMYDCISGLMLEYYKPYCKKEKKKKIERKIIKLCYKIATAPERNKIGNV